MIYPELYHPCIWGKYGSTIYEAFKKLELFNITMLSPSPPILDG